MRRCAVPAFALSLLTLLLPSSSLLAQSDSTPIAATAPTVVPALVPYSGAVRAFDGRAGEFAATFLIFKDEQGGEPLFIESQMVAVDATGHFKAELGAAYTNGLPLDLFATGEARWLEVQIAGQPAQARVLLASVPYALKAADAATLGGLPASAFALAGSHAAVASVAPAGITPDGVSNVTTTGGTANQVAKFSGASTIVNSILYDNGTNVGIGTSTPTATLTVGGTLAVSGNSTFNGQLVLPAAGIATETTPYDSQFIKFTTSAYNSSTKKVVAPRFQLDAIVTGNDTASPSAVLEMLASSNSIAPAPTGLYFNTDGTIHFAPGQTFGATSASGVAFNGTSTSSTGVEGTSSTGSGVMGTTAGTTSGTAGLHGVAGAGNTSGFTGIAGVWGDSSAQVGVYGTSDYAAGVQGNSELSVGGLFGSGQSEGVVAYGGVETGCALGGGDCDSNGMPGISAYGGSGFEEDGPGGFFQGGNNSTLGDGIEAFGGQNEQGQPGKAGEFDGEVDVYGTINGDVKDFRIDHPSDPANKYLVHASIESSEMVNIYSGNVVTDESGLATVQLPDWFEAENADFRYELTVLDERFVQAGVSRKIQNHQFTIHTNASHVEVSWQITGVRQDAYAKAHPLVVEEVKDVRERGFYRHPELYGQPAEKQTEWGRHPQMMQHMKAEREAQKNRPKPAAVNLSGKPGLPTNPAERNSVPSALPQHRIPMQIGPGSASPAARPVASLTAPVNQ